MGSSLGGRDCPYSNLLVLVKSWVKRPLDIMYSDVRHLVLETWKSLHQFGTKNRKQNYLHPLVRGDIRSCFSMTEPDFAGSNPIHMATTAVRDGGDYAIMDTNGLPQEQIMQPLLL